MSEQTGGENVSDGLTAYSVDDENQLQPEDTLVPGGDPVEQGYETSNRLKSATFYNEDEDGESHEETIDERISQEVPDPDSAYGALRTKVGWTDPRWWGATMSMRSQPIRTSLVQAVTFTSWPPVTMALRATPMHR
ncbi:hypothetical protein [Ornithinimicrobium sp. INDO-MA30-4]|uniref:hypothetical protein n=1 Tax=Ornithinimicrobium sp. INDO-MA30-4 TaxID=2908651 RepID=UPI001F1747D7|nr:hypothetical protein [Ornithinimicrobium sp. INDO-MA30-4]UJH70547.1 hypothetical protein L0A91_16080 [Ornithinimicrobium sp. INDO-MA30-4]